MRKSSEVLEEYLAERDRQNSDYYDNRQIDARMEGRWLMQDLAKELDELVHGVEPSRDWNMIAGLYQYYEELLKNERTN